MPIPEEPLSDSLKDVEDLSLRFSVEGDFKHNGELDAATRQRELIEAITRMASSNSNTGVNYGPGRRQRLFVIAIDCYDQNGDDAQIFQETLMCVKKAASVGHGQGQVGLVLLTGSSLQETIKSFKGCQVNIEDFDALVCKSGSEMYYPWRDLAADADYEIHIEYRWPGENVRSMVPRLATLEVGADDDIMEYAGSSSSRCYSYNVKPGAKVRNLLCCRKITNLNGKWCLKTYICSFINFL